MVNLLFLDSTSPLPFPLQASPTDSVQGLKLQIAANHPSSPKLDDVRLVRAGRFLKDSELVQDVLGLGKKLEGGGGGEDDGTPHTIHLVLRGGQGREREGAGGGAKEASSSSSGGGPSTALPHAAATTPILPSSTSSATTFNALPLPPPPNPPLLPDDRVLDLTDAVGLYAHLSRSSLCTLLNLPPVPWEEIVPTPQVSEQDARRLVKQTVEGFGVQSGLGEVEGPEQRGRLEDWVGEYGGEWTVQVDGLPYHLSVPPPSSLTPTQRTALHSYLLYSTRLTLLHQIIQNPLPYILAMLPPSHTQLQRPHPLTPAAVRRQSALVRIVPMMVMNAVKYSLVWYIFTQGETLLSRSLWGFALVGWWMYEGMGEYRRAVGGGDAAVGVVPPPAARPAAAQPIVPAHPPPEGNAPSTDGSDPSTSTPAAPTPPPRPPLPTFHLPPTSSPFHSLALLGLANETHLLALSPSNSPVPIAPPPNTSSHAHSTLKTLLLPPLLLLLSIAPPLEALRSSTLRRRETVMREVVEILTTVVPPSAPSAPAGGNTLNEGEDASPSVVVAPPVHVLPAGLGTEAKAYYRRVLERGERIDWVAEEEAQREVMEREERNRRERLGAGGGGGGGLGGLF